VTETTSTPYPRQTKLQIMIDMLQRSQGATITEIAAATQWQPHTVRGALSGALKKRHGLEITSQVEATRGRIYSLLGTEVMFKSTRAACHTQAAKL
jgi:hypothetical protein